MNRKKKNAAQQRQTSRELIDIQKITEYGLLTSHGELVFFSIEPTNLSVHSPESIGSRIYALMTVLKGMAEIEMLALNSKESFEDNKRHYRQLREQEQLPVIRKLLERDMMGLDRLQVQMATAREFFVIVRLKNEKDSDIQSYLSRIQKNLEDQGFKTRLSSAEERKRMLGVYLEQNATTEKYEDYDGERWVMYRRRKKKKSRQRNLPCLPQTRPCGGYMLICSSRGTSAGRY